MGSPATYPFGVVLRDRGGKEFQATCPRHAQAEQEVEEPGDWDGPMRKTEIEAARDLALHNIDAHGGTPRGES